MINNQLTEFTPLVKLVSTASLATALAIAPNSVLSPTFTATAVAEPEITLVPIYAIFVYSVILPLYSFTCENFSTGPLSPVMLA